MHLKGYCSVRIAVPVSVQNLVIRDYCAKHGHTYLLSDVEYVMEDSFVMLKGLLEQDFPICAYSMFLMPTERAILDGKCIHFALENYELPRDRELCETIWRL